MAARLSRISLKIICSRLILRRVIRRWISRLSITLWVRRIWTQSSKWLSIAKLWWDSADEATSWRRVKKRMRFKVIINRASHQWWHSFRVPTRFMGWKGRLVGRMNGRRRRLSSSGRLWGALGTEARVVASKTYRLFPSRQEVLLGQMPWEVLIVRILDQGHAWSDSLHRETRVPTKTDLVAGADPRWTAKACRDSRHSAIPKQIWIFKDHNAMSRQSMAKVP